MHGLLDALATMIRDVKVDKWAVMGAWMACELGVSSPLMVSLWGSVGMITTRHGLPDAKRRRDVLSEHHRTAENKSISRLRLHLSKPEGSGIGVLSRSGSGFHRIALFRRMAQHNLTAATTGN